MQSRWLTGPLVAGVVLGSIFLACGAQPGDETGAPGATSEPTADVEPLAVLPRTRPLRANGLPAGVKPFRPPVALANDVLPGDVTDDAGGRFHDQVTPTCNNPKLTYFDGPLLQSPVIVPVFWSGSVNAALTAPITGMAQFFADVTQSSYWRWLQEYDTVGLAGGSEQTILGATATAGVTLAPSHCPGTANCTVTDAQIQTELNAQIASGVLPAPTLDCTGNTNTVYMIEFPPNVKVTGPDGAGTSCVQFCAYHNTGVYTGTGASNGKPLVYGVLMDEFTSACKTGCGANATGLENSTDTASHELVEAVTDPDIGLDTQNGYAAPAAWGDNNNQCGEIADICDTNSAGDTITVSGRTWSVQELWSNAQGKCTSTGPDLPVCSGTTLTGCRKCSCGDNAGACTGGTAVCETTATNVLFGACEQCTSTASSACGATGACAQSATPASDDICSCSPLTSCPAGDNCGSVSNGCGGTLSCGACTAPQSCGGGTPVNPNQCGCTPATSCPAGRNCGTASDGCGGNIACGTCTSPQTCGGSGTAGTCGCTPATACPAGQSCGTAPNGCGGSLDCGTCTGPQTCGGGGTANECGCTPLLVCPAGINCGTVPDGCGGVVTCGACSGTETCGGGGTSGVCGCTPNACPTGANCGPAPDGCGATLNCGTCTAPQTCGGGTPSKANQCGCTPVAACSSGQTCGTIADGCGGTVLCGTCSAGQTCSGTNQCVTTVVDAGHDSGSKPDASGDASRVSDGGSDDAADATFADAGNPPPDSGAGDARTGHDSGATDARASDDSGGTDAGHARDSGAKRDADTGAVADGGNPQGDAGPDGGIGDAGANGGCSCRTAPATQSTSPFGLLVLVPLAFVGRRRQRRCGRETVA